MKADDDTYVAVRNLQEHLSKYDSSKEYYFGLILSCHYFHLLIISPGMDYHYNEHVYASGGSGYTISRAALAKLVCLFNYANINIFVVS